MEIVFLLVGLILIAGGAVIIRSEVQARRGTQAIAARVIGFSTGRHNRPTAPSFHSIAEYVGLDGRTYYVEGGVGSSVPLHVVGDSVTVLVKPSEPERAVLKSRLSFVLGGVLALIGIILAAVFWLTFHVSPASLITGVLVGGALLFKLKAAWRKQPLSYDAWREHVKQVLSPRVFTNESKNQIGWADPLSVEAAYRSRDKSRAFALPVLFVLGFGLIFLSYHFYGKTEAFLAHANHASGRVVELRATDSNDDSTTYAAVVEYSDHRGEKRRLVDRFSSSPPSYRTGQVVTVLYNSENPLEAQIDRGRANYWLTILLGSLGVLFVCLGGFSSRRGA
jgi:hypothetical protein